MRFDGWEKSAPTFDCAALLVEHGRIWKYDGKRESKRACVSLFLPKLPTNCRGGQYDTPNPRILKRVPLRSRGGSGGGSRVRNGEFSLAARGREGRIMPRDAERVHSSGEVRSREGGERSGWGLKQAEG